MPEDKDKDKENNKDKKISGEEVDLIIDSLNFEALSKQYQVEIEVTPTASQPENKDQKDHKDQQDEETKLPDQPIPNSKFKRKLLDFLGTLLLLFSLVIFGVPMIVGKFKRQFSAILCLLLSLVVILCSYHISDSYLKAKAAAEQNKAITQEGSGVAAIVKPLLPDSMKVLQPPAQTVTFPQGMLEKYKTAYSINPHVVGRIRIPNTSIDTLVMQDKTNKHYLRYNFYNRYTEFGNAFIDYRNKLDSLNQNTIVYGHATQGKLQVFYDLYKYMDKDFYVHNPIIEFGTLYKDYNWKVFAVYMTSVQSKDDNGYFFYYIHTEIHEAKFAGYLDQIMQRSRFFSDIGITDDDKILTLSTCVYDNNFAGNAVDSRLIVVAKLMHEGENSEIDPSKVIDNPGFRRPQVWYNHFGQKNPYSKSENWKQ